MKHDDNLHALARMAATGRSRTWGNPDVASHHSADAAFLFGMLLARESALMSRPVDQFGHTACRAQDGRVVDLTPRAVVATAPPFLIFPTEDAWRDWVRNHLRGPKMSRPTTERTHP